MATEDDELPVIVHLPVRDSGKMGTNRQMMRVQESRCPIEDQESPSKLDNSSIVIWVGAGLSG